MNAFCSICPAPLKTQILITILCRFGRQGLEAGRLEGCEDVLGEGVIKQWDETFWVLEYYATKRPFRYIGAELLATRDEDIDVKGKTLKFREGDECV